MFLLTGFGTSHAMCGNPDIRPISEQNPSWLPIPTACHGVALQLVAVFQRRTTCFVFCGQCAIVSCCRPRCLSSPQPRMRPPGMAWGLSSIPVKMRAGAMAAIHMVWMWRFTITSKTIQTSCALVRATWSATASCSHGSYELSRQTNIERWLPLSALADLQS